MIYDLRLAAPTGGNYGYYTTAISEFNNNPTNMSAFVRA
jgi:hypothetical protein